MIQSLAEVDGFADHSQDQEFKDKIFGLTMAKSLSKALAITSLQAGMALAGALVGLVAQALLQEAALAPVIGCGSPGSQVVGLINKIIQTFAPGLQSLAMSMVENPTLQLLGSYVVPMLVIGTLLRVILYAFSTDAGLELGAQHKMFCQQLEGAAKTSCKEVLQEFGAGTRSLTEQEAAPILQLVHASIISPPNTTIGGCGTGKIKESTGKRPSCGSSKKEDLEPTVGGCKITEPKAKPKSCGGSKVKESQKAYPSCPTAQASGQPPIRPLISNPDNINLTSANHGQELATSRGVMSNDQASTEPDGQPQTEDSGQESSVPGQEEVIPAISIPYENFPVVGGQQGALIAIPERVEGWNDTIHFLEEEVDPNIPKNPPEIREKINKLRDTVFEIKDVLKLEGRLKEELEANAKTTQHSWPSKICKARIYKAAEDIPAWGIKKGQFFYLDLSKGHYGDHIEVFGENKFAVGVRRLDGTLDEFNTRVALGEIDSKGVPMPKSNQYIRRIDEGSFKQKLCEIGGCEDCLK